MGALICQLHQWGRPGEQPLGDPDPDAGQSAAVPLQPKLVVVWLKRWALDTGEVDGAGLVDPG